MIPNIGSTITASDRSLQEDRMSDPYRARSIELPRRDLLAAGLGTIAAAALPFEALAGPSAGHTPSPSTRNKAMNYVTTRDGVEIFYKDWGPRTAQPIVFHHGWPLSSDDWDPQMMFFLQQGFRVIAHDRRGHGRSSQVDGGHDLSLIHI